MANLLERAGRLGRREDDLAVADDGHRGAGVVGRRVLGNDLVDSRCRVGLVRCRNYSCMTENQKYQQ